MSLLLLSLSRLLTGAAGASLDATPLVTVPFIGSFDLSIDPNCKGSCTSGVSCSSRMHFQGSLSSSRQKAWVLSPRPLKRNAQVYPLAVLPTKAAVPSRLPVCHQLPF